MCPNCNILLIKRINKKSKDWFLGCPNFPKCKFSQNRPDTAKEMDIKIWAWANSQGIDYP